VRNVAFMLALIVLTPLPLTAWFAIWLFWLRGDGGGA
jgi:hypothetical protein